MKLELAITSVCVLLQILILPANQAFAQTTSSTISTPPAHAPVALEPGEAQARESAPAPVSLPSQWSHPAKEARAAWLSSHELLEGRAAIIKILDKMAAAHFNAILLDTWFRGYMIYPGSKYVPQYPGLASDTQTSDILRWIIDEAHNRHLQVHAWPEYGFYAYNTKDATKDKSRGALLDAHPDLTAVSASGIPYLHNPTFGDYYSLCPSNPGSARLLAGLYREMLSKYDFDGLNLDRMRYPSGDYCFCDYCKQHFKADTGIDLKPFDKGTTEAEAFVQWKRGQMLEAVRTIATAARQVLGKKPITAYVVGPDEMNEKAQSWDMWMKAGLLDAVAVSMYGPDITKPARRSQELLGAYSNRLICALNAGLSDPELLLQNINEARKFSPLGQFIWYTGNLDPEYNELLMGPYAKPAQWPIAHER